MSKRLFVLFVLLMMPVLAFGQDSSRDFSGWHWYDDGITFTYSFRVADNIGSRWLPASANQPERVQFFFENYHGNGQWIETGSTIDIIPVSTLPGGLLTLPETLKTLPSTRGDVLLNQLSQIVQSGDIPVAAAQSAFLDFQSGTGVRFIATAGDGTHPVRLSYRYLGMTADNNYLIMALFPVTVTNLEVQVLEELEDFSPKLEVLDNLIASLKVTPPEAMLLTTQTNGQVDCGDIQFTYDASLAYRIEMDAVAPLAGDMAANTMYGVTPGYQQFSFVGFPAVGSIHSPQLFVMPVSQFPGEDQPYGIQLRQLQALLTGQPELAAVADPARRQGEPLPILPLMNAAQTIVSQPQYMRFGNGEGLRYITYYAQDAAPLTANDLFYTFAGMSDDGQYVVSAIFPLFAEFLPQGRAAYNIADWERFAMNYQTYLDGLLLQVEVMDSNVYVPQIHLLDELTASVTVAENSDTPTVCDMEIR